jgi:DNA-binding transcriptional LysR family regulator
MILKLRCDAKGVIQEPKLITRNNKSALETKSGVGKTWKIRVSHADVRASKYVPEVAARLYRQLPEVSLRCATRSRERANVVRGTFNGIVARVAHRISV